jgi:hypothetical protein
MSKDVAVTHDIIGLHDGRPLLVHLPEKCAGRACCVHNPSTHPLSSAPLSWRSDRGLMERICQHGCGHPDPDDLAHKRETMGPARYAAGAWGSHGCCGCCGVVAS